MATSFSNVIFLKHFVIAHGNGNGDLKEEDWLLFSSFLPMEGSHWSKAKLLKDSGNDFFKQNLFESAGGCYDMECRLLCLGLESKEKYDVDSVSQLAISLNLNLAACANKLQEYETAINCCSLVLASFPNNAKALFRRAIALMKSNMLLEAQTDLETASVLEPKNKDILRELNVVKNLRAINYNGKRSMDDQLVNELVNEVDRDTKRPTAVNTEGNSAANGSDGSDCGSCATLLSDSGVKDTIMSDDSHPHFFKESYSPNLALEHNHKEFQIGDNNQIPPSNSVLEFSRKGGENSRLRISTQTYQKLLQGRKVSYYNKRSLSTMTIRILSIEATKEGGTTREPYKRRKRRRRSRKRKLKTVVMNEDMAPSSSLGVTKVIQGISSRDSSLSEVNQSLYPKFVTDSASFRLHAKDDSDEQPFLFSAGPKKCKFYSFGNVPRASKARRIRRYTSGCRMSEEKRVSIFKKKVYSQGNESPRRNLSTCSTSRSFPYKCLRPRGVSVSCCRYYPEAKLNKKRKEVFALSACSDRPRKKHCACDNPNSSLNSVLSSVVIIPDSHSRAL